MAEVNEGVPVQEPVEQSSVGLAPDEGIDSEGPGQGGLDEAGISASQGAEPTAEEPTPAENEDPLGYAAEQGGAVIGPADGDAQPNLEPPDSHHAAQDAQLPEARFDAAEAADASPGFTVASPAAAPRISEGTATPSKSSRPSRRGTSSGGAPVRGASPALAQVLGKPPSPLALPSPAASATGVSPQPGVLGTELVSRSGSARTSASPPGSQLGQRRPSRRQSGVPLEGGPQVHPDATPFGPEPTPQDAEPTGAPAPPDASKREPEQLVEPDEPVGTADQDGLYGAGEDPDQPLYDPEEGTYAEGGVEAFLEQSITAGDHPPLDEAGQALTADEDSGVLGQPPLCYPEDQPPEEACEAEDQTPQPGPEEDQQAQDGVSSPSGGNPEEQPPRPASSTEVQAGPEAEPSSGTVFITEARVKRGIPRFRRQPPPPPPPVQEASQEQGEAGDKDLLVGPGVGPQPQAEGEGPQQPGHRAGEQEEGDWASGRGAEEEERTEQNPAPSEAAASPSGFGGGQGAGGEGPPPPDSDVFPERGEAEVELQYGSVRDQRQQQEPPLYGEPSGDGGSGGDDYRGPEYDTAPELMAGGGGSATGASAPDGAGAGGDLDAGGYGGYTGYTSAYTGGADSTLQSPDRGYSPGEGLEGDDDAYGRGGGGGAAASPRGVGGYGVGGGGDSDPALAMERERLSQQLQMEVRAREELEDMILRIEKHFKAEQAARKKAEELLQASIAAELETKNRLEDSLMKRREEQKQMEEERNGIKRERNALEGMRQDFEAELQAARMEVAKAQDALAASEDRIRAAEAVDRARLEAEYQSKINSLQEENGRLRDEMAYRTQMMASEMTRWQQQAHLTAAAVMEAKNEVLERKKELDSTKEKMDRLLDKLYIGRERNIELSGAIAAAQSYAQHAGAHGGLASVAGMMPPALLMGQGQGGGFGNGGPGGARGAALLAALPPLPGGLGSPPGGGGGGVHSSIPKLPPLNARPPLYGGGEPGLVAGPPLSGGPRRSAPGSQTAYDGAGGANLIIPGFMGAPPGMMHPMGMMGPMGMGPMGGMGGPMGSPMGGPMGSFGGPPGGMGGNPGGQDQLVDPYSHVQSRFAQPTEAALAKQEAAKKGRANGKAKKLDRFEEGKRDEARMAAMAKRWQ